MKLLAVIITIFALSCQQAKPKTEKSVSRNPAVNPTPDYRQQQIPPYQYQPQAIPQTKTACYKTTDEMCAIEVEILKKTNEYRISKGKTALLLGEKLSFAAREWSKDQADRGKISHKGFPSNRSEDISTEYQSTSGLSIGAENVAYTYGGSSSDIFSQATSVGGELTEMWIGSWGHRRNILANHSVIGIGVHKDSRGRYYATQIFGNESGESTIAQSEINLNSLVRSPEQNQQNNFDNNIQYGLLGL